MEDWNYIQMPETLTGGHLLGSGWYEEATQEECEYLGGQYLGENNCRYPMKPGGYDNCLNGEWATSRYGCLCIYQGICDHYKYY